MKKIFTLSLLIIVTLSSGFNKVKAQEERTSIEDLPFSGYYLAPEEHAIEGLLFESNQLYIYMTDTHGHDENIPGHEWVDFLEGFHSFPHPDLRNYTASVRERYLAEYDLPYNLQEVYVEITEQITPEMSQMDVQNLINNRIPGIYYTEKDHYQYYIIASPTVLEADSAWQIQLFGEELFTLEYDMDQGLIRDQDGVIYEFLAGIKPN